MSILIWIVSLAVIPMIVSSQENENDSDGSANNPPALTPAIPLAQLVAIYQNLQSIGQTLAPSEVEVLKYISANNPTTTTAPDDYYDSYEYETTRSVPKLSNKELVILFYYLLSKGHTLPFGIERAFLNYIAANSQSSSSAPMTSTTEATTTITTMSASTTTNPKPTMSEMTTTDATSTEQETVSTEPVIAEPTMEPDALLALYYFLHRLGITLPTSLQIQLLNYILDQIGKYVSVLP